MINTCESKHKHYDESGMPLENLESSDGLEIPDFGLPKPAHLQNVEKSKLPLKLKGLSQETVKSGAAREKELQHGC